MCGIAGISLSPNDKKMNVREVATDLLLGIASRGPDATGAAWYDHTKDTVELTKIAVNTAKFLAARKEIMPETTPVMILHTRMATTGDKRNRMNNHPIHHGNIVGIHNGVLWGHTEMFKEMKREPLADVDSEAIFALLNDGVRPEKVLNKVEGDAAVAWIDLTDPEVLHLARVVDRPLFIAQTEEGSLLFASTKSTIDDAARKSGLKIEFAQEVEEGKYLKVVGGVIAEYLDIPGVKRDAAWSRKYAYTSGHQTAGWGQADEDWDWGQGAGKGNATTAEIKADAAIKKDVEVATLAWFAAKTNKELANIAKSGSKTAVAELGRRGMDEAGELVFLLTDDELVALAETVTNGHRWAVKQLAFRGKNPDGTLTPEADSVTDTDELVVLAAGGSDMAVEALKAQGYDRTGTRLVLPAIAR